MKIRNVNVFAALVTSSAVAASVFAGASGASAMVGEPAPSPAVREKAASGLQAADTGFEAPSGTARRPEGLASMYSPYIPGVPHVPADVILALSPKGGAFYFGPVGSLFNGPADEVDIRVDAWWAEQMAAGVTPKQADEMLANPK